jgi:dipeptidyl aminopeptidase/acylaminoacyl peptidase
MYEFQERIAPLNHAGEITKPIFVVHGRNDPRVPWSESDQIVKAVRANGVPAWYLIAEDEGHGFRKKSNKSFQLYATVMFVKQYLLAADSDPPGSP